MGTLDERRTIIATTEAQEAFQAARDLLTTRDQVAARMAFKARYEELVREARAAGLPLSLIRPVADRATYNLGLLFPPFRPGGRLLDIGCGHGWYVRIMRDWGWDAIGVEADGGAAARGRAAYGDRKSVV